MIIGDDGEVLIHFILHISYINFMAWEGAGRVQGARWMKSALPVNFQDAMQPSHAAVLGRNVAAHRVESCLHPQTLHEHDYLQRLRQCFTRQALCQQKWKNTPKAPAPSREGGGPLRHQLFGTPDAAGHIRSTYNHEIICVQGKGGVR